MKTTMKAKSGTMTITTMENGTMVVTVKTIFSPLKGTTKYGLERVQ